LSLDTFYNECLGFSNYGTPNKNSKEAKRIGGRMPEPHHFQYFRFGDGSIRMRYKYAECEDGKMYLPRPPKEPIHVSRPHSILET
jgi:hypothetical protein